MVLVTPNTQALQGLCSEDRLDLLNVVDDLRAHGLSNYVSLPQIIVCGDQSSGKSSVLEAISGVSFPIQSGVCTRFPTELVLRKTDEPSVTVSIVPDPSHSEAEKESLLKFNNSLEGYEELPALINKAKLAMGILPHGKAFSKDILRVEVSGPDRPQLTIVDLPGLIHSPTKQQSATDVEVVKSLVDDYMKETRSIILAVVSAKYDYANQIVLKLSRATDESGERSLGVITKPDKLKPSSISENAFISLARNRDVYFHHGWHVLKNMDTEDGEASLPTRDAEEQNFFSRGVWRALPRIDLGIGHLRQRLSKLLLGQIVSELPSLIKEIETRSNECGQRLDQFGSPRITLEEQKSYLLRISQSFQSLVKAAVDGTYNDSFFGDAQLEIGYRKRMRAVAQNLNTTFETKIRIQGHLREIVRYVRESESTSQKPIPITRENFLEQVRRLLERTRGRELPGTFNPMVVKDLFSEQCVPWADIANQHIQSVWEAAKDFLELVITDVADETTAKAVLRNIFNPALDDIWSQLKDKTEDLLSWHQTGHPITYNHYFSETLQNIRSKRRREGYAKAVRGHFGRGSSGGFGIDSNVDIEALVDKLVSENEPDMDRFAASEALDCMKAYYKVTRCISWCISLLKGVQCAMKRFVDDIAVEVVEKTMIRKLESIFTPVSIFHLADKDVERIAGESEESRVQREELNQQLDILNKGSRVCKGYSAARSLGKQS